MQEPDQFERPCRPQDPAALPRFGGHAVTIRLCRRRRMEKRYLVIAVGEYAGAGKASRTARGL
jgi:hypothetical protein